jgi:catechol 2,3-dioxygenase-like lactoylglutathione lyase family enzyme
MRLFLPIFASILACQSLVAQIKVARPRITGIDHVRLSVTDLDKSREFYSKLFGIRSKGGMCFDTLLTCFTVGWAGSQTIELEKANIAEIKNLLGDVSLTTDDIERMRSYLAAQGITVSQITKGKYSSHFELQDPEGIPISFIQRSGFPVDDPPVGAPWYVRIVHAGFVVRNRPAEEHFYQEILGFRPYWHGGMKDDQTDWVSLQVPNGTDWLEFMVNVSPTASHHTLGVMNHIALGTKDIHVTDEQLIKNGWKPTEEPKLGRDGKWQLNLYDPDDTRVEYMEFKPKEKPCCSEFTGQHPGP